MKYDNEINNNRNIIIKKWQLPAVDDFLLIPLHIVCMFCYRGLKKFKCFTFSRIILEIPITKKSHTRGNCQYRQFKMTKKCYLV